MNVGQDTARGDGHATQPLAELLVVADGQLDVPGDDAGLLVVASSVSCQLKDLSSKVLQDGCQVHRGTSTDAAGVLHRHCVDCWTQEARIKDTGTLLAYQTPATTTHKECGSPVCRGSRNKQDNGTHLALLQVAGNAAHGELQTGLGGPGHCLLGRLSLSAARHGCRVALCVPWERLNGCLSLYFSFLFCFSFSSRVSGNIPEPFGRMA